MKKRSVAQGRGEGIEVSQLSQYGARRAGLLLDPLSRGLELDQAIQHCLALIRGCARRAGAASAACAARAHDGAGASPPGTRWKLLAPRRVGRRTGAVVGAEAAPPRARLGRGCTEWASLLLLARFARRHARCLERRRPPRRGHGRGSRDGRGSLWCTRLGGHRQLCLLPRGHGDGRHAVARSA